MCSICFSALFKWLRIWSQYGSSSSGKYNLTSSVPCDPISRLTLVTTQYSPILVTGRRVDGRSGRRCLALNNPTGVYVNPDVPPFLGRYLVMFQFPLHPPLHTATTTAVAFLEILKWPTLPDFTFSSFLVVSNSPFNFRRNSYSFQVVPDRPNIRRQFNISYIIALLLQAYSMCGKMICYPPGIVVVIGLIFGREGGRFFYSTLSRTAPLVSTVDFP